MPYTLRLLISNKLYHSLLLLFIIYMVGIVSVLLGYADALMKLTPFNLIFASALILYNAVRIDRVYVLWFLVVGIAGFLVEWLGIETGMIFGDYYYGDGLGWKLLDVPLIIGVNWAVLVFASSAITNGFRWPVWLKSAFGAALMVSYDIFLEPVAVRFDFWTWENGLIPLQNYLAWWIIAFIMLLGVNSFVRNKTNQLALPVLITQSIFFIVVILKESLVVFN